MNISQILSFILHFRKYHFNIKKEVSGYYLLSLLINLLMISKVWGFANNC